MESPLQPLMPKGQGERRILESGTKIASKHDISQVYIKINGGTSHGNLKGYIRL